MAVDIDSSLPTCDEEEDDNFGVVPAKRANIIELSDDEEDEKPVKTPLELMRNLLEAEDFLNFHGEFEGAQKLKEVYEVFHKIRLEGLVQKPITDFFKKA